MVVDSIRFFRAHRRKFLEIKGELFSEKHYSFQNGELCSMTLLDIDISVIRKKLNTAGCTLKGKNCYILKHFDRIEMNGTIKSIRARDICIILYGSEMMNNSCAAVISYVPV